MLRIYPKTLRAGLIFVICLFGLAQLVAQQPASQQFNFPNAEITDPRTRPNVMLKLATEVMAAYTEADRIKYLDNLFRLQIVAGRYADAVKTITSLRALQINRASPQTAANNVQYEIFGKARARQIGDGLSFEDAFRKSFREVFGTLDDRTSALVIRALGVFQSALQQDLNRALERQKDKPTISMSDALALVRAYQIEQSYKGLSDLAGPLIAEDDHRRYLIDEDVRVKTPDGATICGLVVRPRSVKGRLPALLAFTIYADSDLTLDSSSNRDDARRTASNGYAGVVGYTRGKRCSPDEPVPYEHDGADAATLIDWISHQSWSDGRVGMYEGSYAGFTQWAAAKHLPKALKALMPQATAAPAIDVPMEGNIFESFVYPWPFYTTNVKTVDNATYNDSERWNRLSRNWYTTGRPYRDLDKIDGTPNVFFDRWLNHPSYDAYWQGMIPYKEEFARINIPILSTAGYFGGGVGAVSYYFSEHYKYNSRAEHYLVIGPYDHFMAQTGTVGRLGGAVKALQGYELDPVAQIDLGELRYQWFDYVFKSGPRPSLLKDKVNYEVMGANVWKHAPSFAAMGNHTLRFHLSSVRSGDSYLLSQRQAVGDAFIPQTVNLADRADVDRVVPGGGIVDKAIDTWNGIEFVSEPLTPAIELSGLFSGRLDFITNKKDFDFTIQLYELTTKGEYVQLSYFLQRASYVKDRSHRQFLTPARRMRLDFKSERLTSRQFQAGSRLVVVLSIVKESDIQINYGTGKDVSDESIVDAKDPLLIKWFDDSVIDIPVNPPSPTAPRSPSRQHIR